MTITTVMNMVIKETENDIKAMEKKPFNGKNVGAMFGNVSAAIVALATAVKN